MIMIKESIGRMDIINQTPVLLKHSSFDTVSLSLLYLSDTTMLHSL